MVQIGTVISLSVNSDEPEEYVVTERLDDLGHGEGGWRCVDIEALNRYNSDNGYSISAFDCWQVTDRYLEVQLQRGVIRIVETKQ